MGHVQAKSLHVIGTVKGVIQVEGLVKLASTAHVEGTVQASALAIEVGAQVQGQVVMAGVPSRPESAQPSEAVFPEHSGDGRHAADVRLGELHLAVSGDGSSMSAESLASGNATPRSADLVSSKSNPRLAYTPPCEIRDDTDAFMQFASEPAPSPEPVPLVEPTATAFDVPIEGWDDWAEPEDEEPARTDARPVEALNAKSKGERSSSASHAAGIDRFW